ncbi:MAG: ABC transporter ATP-binding protein [Lachnospiraceae bacterium]|nr:ABC transporter ATP-binding protein [Lachnospiraceae bacterium]
MRKKVIIETEHSNRKDAGQESFTEGLKVENLSKKYRNFQLGQVNFAIPPGNILGLLGQNGSGKTTTIKILAGHTKKNQGRIWINGVSLEKHPIQAKAQIGFMLEGPMFFENKSLWENGKAFGRFYPNFTEKNWRKWLSVCKLQPSSWLGLLSQGERMKFQFAFAMAHCPKVLLLDEPTGNLDPVFRREFLDILQEVVEEEQISVVFSTHLTSDLERIADQIVLLDQGRMLYADTIEHMQERYCLVKGGPKEGRDLKERGEPGIVGIQISQVGYEAMVDLNQSSDDFRNKIQQTDYEYETIDLSKWMYYMTKGGNNCGSYVETNQAV